MKTFTLIVPDDKAEFLQHFAQQNAFEISLSEEDFEVPEWHKEIVRERIRTEKEEDFITMDQFRKLIRK